MQEFFSQTSSLQLVSFLGVRYEGLYSKLSLPPVLGFLGISVDPLNSSEAPGW